MKVVSYIESIIDVHQKIYGIYFHSIHREYIQDQVNKGIYAFQVIYEPGGEEFFNKLWSYDGKRFQWSDTETLVFDPSKIRDIKLEEIIK